MSFGIDLPFGTFQKESQKSLNSQIIRKTCPCNISPLKPHFYIVKLGNAGVYLIFSFLIQNIHCGYSLEPRVPTMYVLSKNKKNIQKHSTENFQFLLTFKKRHK